MLGEIHSYQMVLSPNFGEMFGESHDLLSVRVLSVNTARDGWINSGYRLQKERDNLDGLYIGDVTDSVSEHR